MASGLKTLHEIDRAIARARIAVDEAGLLTERASTALATTKQNEIAQLAVIAKDRLSVLEKEAGGDLGYVDRQAKKYFDLYKVEHAEGVKAVKKGRNQLEKLEMQRRTLEADVNEAVDDYDLAAARAEIKILKDPEYIAQLDFVAHIENQVLRASEKQILAQEDQTLKGKAFLEDPYFAYLRAQGFGTKQAKGWFLTQLLDGWVARLTGYRQSAETYQRLTEIPLRLERHVEHLDAKLGAARLDLEGLEADILKREGVSALHSTSLSKQAALEVLDAEIEQAETHHAALIARQSDLSGAVSGPLKDAIDLIVNTLQKTSRRTLQKLTAQTVSKSDDAALDELASLSQLSEDLTEDHAETLRLAKQYRKTLSELEQLRKNFKARRFDAPSSEFSNGELISRLLGQVVMGALASDDFWRQLGRFQKTVKRYSDYDFGGDDWTEGLRLPKNGRGRPNRSKKKTSKNKYGKGSRQNTVWDDILNGTTADPFGGGWPKSGHWGGNRRQRRTSIPRTPRIRLPRSTKRSGGGRSGGGFRTGGGF